MATVLVPRRTGKVPVPQDHTVLYAGEYMLVVKPDHGDPNELRFWYGVPSPWLHHVKNDNRNSERIRQYADTVLTDRVRSFRLYWEMLNAVHGMDPDYHRH